MGLWILVMWGWFWNDKVCWYPFADYDIWVKPFIRNVVLTVSRRKNSKLFPFFRVFLVKCLWKCPSSTKPPLPWKMSGCASAWRNNTKVHVFKVQSSTKEKFDSLILSRSCLWMVWRCHCIPLVHCYHFV